MMGGDDLDRFGRLRMLVGRDGLDRLSGARVAVAGLGGVGSYAVEALARAGVGWLILIDHDDISPTNTNRQIHALAGNYGRPKVEVMEERIKAINPEAAVVAWREFLTADNLPVLLHGRISYVVDAIDTVSSKADLIEYCVAQDIPVISVMGTGNKLDPLALRVEDISRTHTCPLAKAVRKALREKGITGGVKAVFSLERAVEPRGEPVDCPALRDGGTAPPCGRRCRVPGSTSFVPPAAGLIAAGVAIREILGI